MRKMDIAEVIEDIKAELDTGSVAGYAGRAAVDSLWEDWSSQINQGCQMASLVDDIDELVKWMEDFKRRVIEESTIVIVCSGGMVREVDNLPEGYSFIVQDLDDQRAVWP